MLIGTNVAILQDASGENVGNIIMSPDEAATERVLGKKKAIAIPVAAGPPPPPPPPVPPPIEGVFKAYPSEMYCRYGCGNIMGVTFPYYYRPFFGYGFPLLGTESYFPAGYGGNPVTALGVTGALGPPPPPGALSNLPAPPGAFAGAVPPPAVYGGLPPPPI